MGNLEALLAWPAERLGGPWDPEGVGTFENVILSARALELPATLEALVVLCLPLIVLEEGDCTISTGGCLCLL